MSYLGFNVRYLRWRAGVTQEVLADGAGVSREFVHRVETEKGGGRLRVQHYRLADYFGYEVGELMERSLEGVNAGVVVRRVREVRSCVEIEDKLVELGYCVRSDVKFIG